MLTVRRFLTAALLLSTSPLHAATPVAFLAYPAGEPNFKTQSVSANDGPYRYHVGTDLIVAEPDGTETVLVVGNQPEKLLLAVHDYCMSIDGTRYIYAHIRTFADRGRETYCDLFSIPVAGGEPTQLTNSRDEWSGPTGYYPAGFRMPVWNAGPCDTPAGIVFCSNRDGVQSPGEKNRSHQLYRLHDGETTKIGHLNLGGVLHPALMPDGSVLFSSAEQQSLRFVRGGGWGIWKIYPDGGSWEPIISAVPPHRSRAWHNATVTSDGSVVSDMYYDTRVWGTLHRVPPFLPSAFSPPSPFGHPEPLQNPRIWDGRNSDADRYRSGNHVRFSWQPREAHSLLPWASSFDRERVDSDGSFLGMVGQPAAMPGNGVMFTWTGDNGDRDKNCGIYAVLDVATMNPDPNDPLLPPSHPRDLVKIVDKPDRHEWFGKPVVPFAAIHGHEPGVPITSLAPELPPGSPYAVIGSTSVDHPEALTPDDAGGVAGNRTLLQFDPEDVEEIRFLGFNATQDGYEIAQRMNNSFPSIATNDRREGFSSPLNERVGFYEQRVFVKKWLTPDGSLHVGPNPPDGSQRLLHPDGTPDTSFKAFVPANQPWSVQLLNAKGESIVTAKTWHQGIPREKRVNCQGCHNHWKPDQWDFSAVAASRPDYVPAKLTKLSVVEYRRDIQEFDERLGLGLGPRPWDSKTAPKLKAYESRISTVDDDPRLTPEEALKLRTWQDTGFLAAGAFNDGTQITEDHGVGPFADTIPPTLVMEIFNDRIVLGYADPQSGIRAGTLSLRCSIAIVDREANTELSEALARNDIANTATLTLEGPLPEGAVVTASVRDRQTAHNSAGDIVSEEGNLTVIKRTIKGPLPPYPTPPDPAEEIAILLAEIAILEAERDAIDVVLDEKRARLAELEGQQ